MGMLQMKRVYEEPEEQDGYRILVDRLWPRGISKEKAKLDLWEKSIAPDKGTPGLVRACAGAVRGVLPEGTGRS
jgi:uncharacterized protein YeaO (DUF488 family)